MNVKTIVSIALVVIIVVSVVVIMNKNIFAVDENEKTAAEAATFEGNSAEKPVAAEKTVVYYFHGNTRCVTCQKIESLTKKAVDEGFADLVKTGQVEVKTINLDDPENEHFVEAYQLSTRCVVVSRIKDGKEVKWERLDEVWTLVKEEETAFTDYIKNSITSVLKEDVDA